MKGHHSSSNQVQRQLNCGPEDKNLIPVSCLGSKFTHTHWSPFKIAGQNLMKNLMRVNMPGFCWRVYPSKTWWTSLVAFDGEEWFVGQMIGLVD